MPEWYVAVKLPRTLVSNPKKHWARERFLVWPTLGLSPDRAWQIALIEVRAVPLPPVRGRPLRFRRSACSCWLVHDRAVTAASGQKYGYKQESHDLLHVCYGFGTVFIEAAAGQHFMIFGWAGGELGGEAA